ncbi:MULTISPECIES: hypothetical protein [Henriciella]|uniref:hypothetical protein n=1 Tax=Henriciella TaxID=453849 RepID=UPI0035187E0D
MSRPGGTRNADYDEKREALVNALADYVNQTDVVLPSLRQLSIAVGSSQPRINHYFGNRTGVIIAIINRLGELGEPIRDQLREPRGSLLEAAEKYAQIAESLSRNPRYVNAHIFAIREGLTNPEVAKAYNAVLVAPTIEAIAESFVNSPGGPDSMETARIAADMIMSSVMMTSLRQAFQSSPEAAGELHREHAIMVSWMTRGLVQDPNAKNMQVRLEEEAELS